MSHSNRAAMLAAIAFSAVAASAQAGVVDLSTLQLNGAATVPAPGVLRLTYGANLANPDDPGSNIGYASSAFIGSAFSSGITFTSSFTFTMTGTGFDPQADGLTFMIQNDPAGAAALGGGGGGIGADGLTKNVGVGFQSWDNDHATIFTDGQVFGGTAQLFHDNPDDPDGDPLKTPNFLLGHNPLNVVNVSVAYDGTTLSYTADNITTGQSISDSLAFDLTSLGPQVYIGFTGATGLSYSIEDITDWKLDVVSPVAAAPEPASWALMIAGFGGMGAMLRRRRAVAA